MWQELMHSAHDLLRRFGAQPSPMQAARKLMEEATEVKEAARLHAEAMTARLQNPYSHSRIASVHDTRAAVMHEAIDVIVTAMNVLYAAGASETEIATMIETVIAKNDAKTAETHELNRHWQGVQRRKAGE